MGGEHRMAAAASAILKGSPPHGRGARDVRSARDDESGLTPAWAGSTWPSSHPARQTRAHPRMGGEHRVDV